MRAVMRSTSLTSVAAHRARRLEVRRRAAPSIASCRSLATRRFDRVAAAVSHWRSARLPMPLTAGVEQSTAASARLRPRSVLREFEVALRGRRADRPARLRVRPAPRFDAQCAKALTLRVLGVCEQQPRRLRACRGKHLLRVEGRPGEATPQLRAQLALAERGVELPGRPVRDGGLGLLQIGDAGAQVAVDQRPRQRASRASQPGNSRSLSHSLSEELISPCDSAVHARPRPHVAHVCAQCQ